MLLPKIEAGLPQNGQASGFSWQCGHSVIVATGAR